MKPVFWLLTVTSLVVSACATNSDGSTTIGARGSPAWIALAPQKDVQEHFDKMQVHELCILWQKERNREEILNQISLSLKRRGMNPLLCY